MNNAEICRVAALVKRVKEKDDQAFVELYNSMYQKVYFFAYSILKERYMAEDAVQEVFITVYKAIGNLKDDRFFVAWMNQITYYTALRLRTKYNEIPVEKEFLELEGLEGSDFQEDSIYQETLKNEKKRVLYKRIMKLPTEMRAVVIMRYYNGYSLNEIAQVMECPLGTVKSRLNSAKRSLKKGLMMETGLFSTAAFALMVLSMTLAKYQTAYAMDAGQAAQVLHVVKSKLNLASGGAFKKQQVWSAVFGLKFMAGIAAVTVTAGTVVALTAGPSIHIDYPQKSYGQYVTGVRIYVDSVVPIEEVKVEYLDKTVLLQKQKGEDVYVMEPFQNGTYAITATTVSGASEKMNVLVNWIDGVAPVMKTYIWDSQINFFTAEIEEKESGLDLQVSYIKDADEKMFAITASGESQVKFPLGQLPMKVYLYDKAGNYAVYEIFKK